jgi:TetR/AcrR family transcriptional repressor of nem operon
MLALMTAHLDRSEWRPLTRLKQFYEEVITLLEAESCQGGCLVNNLWSEVSALNEGLAAAANAQFRKWIAVLSACIQEGQEAGEITTAQPAEELAKFMHTSYLGAVTRAKAERSVEPLRMNTEMVFRFLEAQANTKDNT